MKFHVIISFVCIFGISSQAAPNFNTEDNYENQLISTTAKPSRLITIQSLLGRNRVQNNEVDPQTKNNLRILSLFEHELNKIFSCYVRLSCPRTRSPQVIEECQEIRDWPLYHQVMSMTNIKRYPYQSYAPQYQNNNDDTNATDDQTPAPRTRRHHRRQRRIQQVESEN